MLFRDRTFSVLVVSAAEKFSKTASMLLPTTDYWPVSTAESAGEARRMLLERTFDLVLVNAPLPDEFGSSLAVDICTNSSTGVLLFVKSELYDDVYNEVMEQGVMVLSKPTSSQMILQTLRNMCATIERLRRMEEKQATIEEKIKEIRRMNRAKWILIEYMGMTEAEAHRFIEKQAMDLRLTKQEVVENIIKTYS